MYCLIKHIPNTLQKEERMRIFLVRIGVLLALISGVVLAQPPQNRPERTMERLKEKLSLTKDQEAKIQSLLDKQREAIAKEREEHQGDREAMRAAMMKQRNEIDAEIEKILTKEQKKKYEEYKKERQEMMKKRMRENNQ